MFLRLSIVLVLLAATLATPFLLRPEREVPSHGARTERLVIITPHTESIRAEFNRAFSRHMLEEHGRRVVIDWRVPGGTAEISKFLKSDYANAFENLWERETGKPFSNAAREGFDGSGLGPDAPEETRKAREMFLDSSIGVGIDLFFGGGAHAFDQQAAAGTLVATDASGQYGPDALREQHPDWFGPEAIPAEFSGEPFHHPDMLWVGACLSTFGICYNTEVLRRLGIEKDPDSWHDLADPRLFGQIAMADPSKSGSVNKAFEMIIQQQIRVMMNTLESEVGDPAKTELAKEEGWAQAMRLILKIGANSRYFTDQATKIPHDVAQGDAAAGMCIDFYGRTFNEILTRPDGTSRMHFVMPEGGTSLGADPIAMLRGAPSPELAHRFLEFCLSIEGQKIWNFRAGVPGGPTRTPLRRPPVRRDFYTPENRALMTDGEVDPFEAARAFRYESDWTGAAFTPLRFIIRCASVDTHPEQKAAWKALIDAGFPEEATALFIDVEAIRYDRAVGEIREILKSKDKIREVELARELSAHFRDKYREVQRLAAQAR